MRYDIKIMTEEEKSLRLEAYNCMKECLMPWDWEEEYNNEPYGLNASLEQIAEALGSYGDEENVASLIRRMNAYVAIMKLSDEELYKTIPANLRDKIYAKVRTENIKADVKDWLEDNPRDDEFCEEDVDMAVEYFIDHHDCEQNYWDNIKGSVEMTIGY